MNTAELLVETLLAWEVPFVFGLVRDGIHPLTEAPGQGGRAEEQQLGALYARACGAEGFACRQPQELDEIVARFLGAAGPALLEATLDPDERPAKRAALRP